MKTTIEDIARASGVSKATVSYVLNNKRSSLGLSAQTVARVLNVSKELKYRPDLVAIALSEQKNVPLSQFSDFMAQVSHVLEETTLEMRLKPTYELYHAGSLRKALRPARCVKFDAVIIIGTSDEDDAFLRKNREKFRNIILLNREVEGYPCSIGNDYEASAELARRIAAAKYYGRYVILHAEKISACEQKRIDGFRDALKKGGETDIRIHESVASDSFDKLCGSLLEQHFREKTLYFIPQYYPAARFLKYLRQKGFSVPQDVGVAAYDSHSLLTDFLSPALTTVDPRIADMTRQALLLARGIKDGKRVSGKVTEPVFESGESAVHV